MQLSFLGLTIDLENKYGLALTNHKELIPPNSDGFELRF